MTRSGCSSPSAIFVIGMPEVLEARIASGADVLLELREDLLLQLELLGHGLDHEVRALERGGEVVVEAEPSRPRCRCLEPVEHAAGELDAGLRALERFLR